MDIRRLIAKLFSWVLLVAFLVTTVMPPSYAHAQSMSLPRPGVLLNTSPAFTPAILRGVKIDPQDPFHFDFMVDKGDSGLEGNALKAETAKLVKYYLATLAVPNGHGPSGAGLYPQAGIRFPR